eukprot:jgi/Botrbrau1/19191/Bobra.0077s0097.2
MDQDVSLLRTKPEYDHYIADNLSQLLGRKVGVKDLEVSSVLGYPPLFDFLPKEFWNGNRPSAGSNTELNASIKKYLIQLYPALSHTTRPCRTKLPRQPDDFGWLRLWKRLEVFPRLNSDFYRIDKFGFVVCKDVGRGDPFAWAVDHFFPSSLGGLDVLPNLNIISEAVNYYKSNKLDCFLDISKVCGGVRASTLSLLLEEHGPAILDEPRDKFLSILEKSKEAFSAQIKDGGPNTTSSGGGTGKAKGLDDVRGVPGPFLLTPRSTHIDVWPQHTRAGSMSAGDREVHRRMRWTEEEEDALYAAVLTCKKGNWAMMRHFSPLLEKFTPLQLKDKWRNLEARDERGVTPRTPRRRQSAQDDQENRLLEPQNVLGSQARRNLTGPAKPGKHVLQHLAGRHASQTPLTPRNVMPATPFEPTSHSSMGQPSGPRRALAEVQVGSPPEHRLPAGPAGGTGRVAYLDHRPAPEAPGSLQRASAPSQRSLLDAPALRPRDPAPLSQSADPQEPALWSPAPFTKTEPQETKENLSHAGGVLRGAAPTRRVSFAEAEDGRKSSESAGEAAIQKHPQTLPGPAGLENHTAPSSRVSSASSVGNERSSGSRPRTDPKSERVSWKPWESATRASSTESGSTDGESEVELAQAFQGSHPSRGPAPIEERAGDRWAGSQKSLCTEAEAERSESRAPRSLVPLLHLKIPQEQISLPALIAEDDHDQSEVVNFVTPKAVQFPKEVQFSKGVQYYKPAFRSAAARPSHRAASSGRKAPASSLLPPPGLTKAQVPPTVSTQDDPVPWGPGNVGTDSSHGWPAGSGVGWASPVGTPPEGLQGRTRGLVNGRTGLVDGEQWSPRGSAKGSLEPLQCSTGFTDRGKLPHSSPDQSPKGSLGLWEPLHTAPNESPENNLGWEDSLHASPDQSPTVSPGREESLQAAPDDSLEDRLVQGKHLHAAPEEALEGGLSHRQHLCATPNEYPKNSLGPGVRVHPAPPDGSPKDSGGTEEPSGECVNRPAGKSGVGPQEYFTADPDESGHCSAGATTASANETVKGNLGEAGFIPEVYQPEAGGKEGPDSAVQVGEDKSLSETVEAVRLAAQEAAAAAADAVRALQVVSDLRSKLQQLRHQKEAALQLVAANKQEAELIGAAIQAAEAEIACQNAAALASAEARTNGRDRALELLRQLAQLAKAEPAEVFLDLAIAKVGPCGPYTHSPDSEAAPARAAAPSVPPTVQCTAHQGARPTGGSCIVVPATTSPRNSQATARGKENVPPVLAAPVGKEANHKTTLRHSAPEFVPRALTPRLPVGSSPRLPVGSSPRLPGLSPRLLVPLSASSPGGSGGGSRASPPSGIRSGPAASLPEPLIGPQGAQTPRVLMGRTAGPHGGTAPVGNQHLVACSGPAHAAPAAEGPSRQPAAGPTPDCAHIPLPLTPIRFPGGREDSRPVCEDAVTGLGSPVVPDFPKMWSASSATPSLKPRAVLPVGGGTTAGQVAVSSETANASEDQSAAHSAVRSTDGGANNGNLGESANVLVERRAAQSAIHGLVEGATDGKAGADEGAGLGLRCQGLQASGSLSASAVVEVPQAGGEGAGTAPVSQGPNLVMDRGAAETGGAFVGISPSLVRELFTGAPMQARGTTAARSPETLGLSKGLQDKPSEQMSRELSVPIERLAGLTLSAEQKSPSATPEHLRPSGLCLKITPLTGSPRREHQDRGDTRQNMGYPTHGSAGLDGDNEVRGRARLALDPQSESSEVTESQGSTGSEVWGKVREQEPSWDEREAKPLDGQSTGGHVDVAVSSVGGAAEVLGLQQMFSEQRVLGAEGRLSRANSSLNGDSIGLATSALDANRNAIWRRIEQMRAHFDRIQTCMDQFSVDVL